MYFLVMNGHRCCATFENTTTPVPPFPKDQEVHILHQIHKQRDFSLFWHFISELTHYENQRVPLSRLPKNNDPRFYLFPVSGIECPVCTNVPGLRAGKCDSGKVPNVTCPDGLDQCISLKGKMTLFTLTLDIELKNCSNNLLCDSASDYNGKNVTAKNLPPPPPPPSPPPPLSEGDSHINYTLGMLGVWCKCSEFGLGQCEF